MSKFVLLAVVVALQACSTMADISASEPESQGVLARAKNAYTELKTKVEDVGNTVVEFIHMYYEDQVKPVTEPYVDWAKGKAKSFWETIKDRLPHQASD